MTVPTASNFTDHELIATICDSIPQAFEAYLYEDDSIIRIATQIEELRCDAAITVENAGSLVAMLAVFSPTQEPDDECGDRLKAFCAAWGERKHALSVSTEDGPLSCTSEITLDVFATREEIGALVVWWLLELTVLTWAASELFADARPVENVIKHVSALLPAEFLPLLTGGPHGRLIGLACAEGTASQPTSGPESTVCPDNPFDEAVGW